MSLLKQAIVDAANLKEAALKNAEQLILEKYSNEVKTAIDSLLEQEEKRCHLNCCMGRGHGNNLDSWRVPAREPAVPGPKHCLHQQHRFHVRL